MTKAELRLQCLELAINSRHIAKEITPGEIVARAQAFFDFVCAVAASPKPSNDVFTYDLPCCYRTSLGVLICQGDVSGHNCDSNVCARQRAALDKFFSQRNPEGDARIAEAVDRGLTVHIPCSFNPIGNLSAVTDLSQVCADREGRLYRYDWELRVLVLLFVPGAAS